MKKIKLLTAFLLISAVLGLTKEVLFQDHLSFFETAYPGITASVEEKQSVREFGEQLSEKLSPLGVRFFFTVRENPSSFFEKVSVYCSDSTVQEALQLEQSVREGIYSGIMESHEIRFYQTETVEAHLNGSISLRFLGDASAISTLEKEVGGLTRGYSSNTDLYVAIGAWILVLAVYTLLTLYEFLIVKKKYALQISMGESPLWIFAKNLLADTATLTGCYFVAMWSFGYFRVLPYLKETLIFSAIGFCAVDAAVFSALFFMRIKNVFFGKVSQKSLLSFSYLLKTVTVVLVVLLVSANGAAINEAIAFSRQQVFFEAYRSYGSYELRLENEKGYSADRKLEKELEYRMWKELYNSKDITVMRASGKLRNRQILIYNRNAKAVLAEQIKSVDVTALQEGGVYVFLPSVQFITALQTEEKEKLRSKLAFNYSADVHDEININTLQPLVYTEDVQLMGFAYEEYGGSSIFENPIIVFSNIDEETALAGADEEFVQSFSPPSYAMGRVSEKEFVEIAEKYVRELTDEPLIVKAVGDNVYENYKHYQELLNKSMQMSAVLCILFLVMEIILIYYVVKLEYTINAKKLAIQKIIGDSVLSCHRGLLLGSVGLSAVSIAVATVVAAVLHFGNILYVMLGGAMIAALDICICLWFIRSAERTQIQKILKGGAL